MKIHPIQLAFPLTRLSNFSAEKTSFFSDISPLGGSAKYTFYKEQDYYTHYSKSYFAVTAKKAGWDCLRHYEIAGSGTLPYFLDIEDCPQNTMYRWPKDLLLEIKNLPGMPTEKEVRKAAQSQKLHLLKAGSSFDEQSYQSLRKNFMDYFLQNLTTESLSAYFLKNLEPLNNKKILLLFGVASDLADYMRDTLICALANDKNVSLTVYPYPYWHLKSCHPRIRRTMYGRGFTYTGNLTTQQLNSPEDWQMIHNSLNEYDVIIATSSSNTGASSLPEEVQESLSTRSDVVWIDGNDIEGDHTIPRFAKTVFRREMP